MFEDNIFGSLDPSLQKAVADAAYTTPTPIQNKAIPCLLNGRDFIGIAQTGSGKTAAFMLPILDRLIRIRRPRHIGHPRALVLSPTRELAVQTASCVRTYSKYTSIPYACVIGGVSQYGQVKDIKKGAEIIVACPGRLIDLMTQGIVSLDQVECFVLDEADRMLDMGFLPDIKRIISKLPVAAKRQSLFFSATMSPAIRSLAGALVTDPVQVTIKPDPDSVAALLGEGAPAGPSKLKDSVMFVERSQKDALLLHLLKTHPEWTKVIVFSKMRHGVDRIAKRLMREEIPCAAIHSDKTQGQRTRALDAFRSGTARVLVATDIASRGIDVPNISCVVNMELPIEVESYIHRVGRTARAGAGGIAISFVAGDERALLKAVERYLKRTIKVDRDQPLHDIIAEEKAGKKNIGLPQAPWIKNDRKMNDRKKGRPRMRRFHKR